MGLTLALLIVVVNALVVSRGETVLARLGDWPLLGQVDVTAEAIAAGAVIGLRAAVAMVAFAVYSACVDPDRVLRALRPLAGRSALTATLVSRLVPVAAADAARLRDAARAARPRRRPGRPRAARPSPPGRLSRPRRRRRRHPGAARLWPRRPPAARRGERAVASRYDRRFYVVGAASSSPRSSARPSAPTAFTPTRRSSSAPVRRPRARPLALAACVRRGARRRSCLDAGGDARGGRERRARPWRSRASPTPTRTRRGRRCATSR